MKLRPLPIGIDNFETMIQKQYYYVDKTLLIRDLLEKKSEVNLFTRPRRFGKTLSVSMLQYFFENTCDEAVNERNRALFHGLKVMEAGDFVAEQMTRYPVITLSFKSAKQPDFDTACYCVKEEIAREFKRHQGVQARLTVEEDRRRFLDIMNQRGEKETYFTALRFLSDCLYQTHGQKVIILIDEYDVPLENAYFCGFYDEMSGFIRSLFESALKTNPSLEFSVITGCLRISKESIFTGLNNLNIISIISEFYGEHFGFTQAEVDDMLYYYRQEDKRVIIKQWYDGYMFCGKEVYNPWSVVSYVNALTGNPDAFPKPYWSNTSSNSIVKELIEEADMEVRAELENLIEGGTIVKQIHEDITYGDIRESQDNLWNFLLFTGYLRWSGGHMEGNRQYASMAIPNEEVKYIYENIILAWFDKKLRAQDLTPFYEALEMGNTDRMEQLLTDILADTISFYDYAENYYHGFVAGILRGNGTYLVKSNRESGNGRPDLVLRTPSVRGRAFIIEIKVAGSLQEMEEKCSQALKQIQDRNYRKELELEGFKNIQSYGFCFWKKEAMVRQCI